MGILDSIKNLADEAVDAVQDAAADAKKSYDERGGISGMLDKAGNELHELGDKVADAASDVADKVKATATSAVDAVQDAANDAKKSYDEHGGISGIADKAGDQLNELAQSAKNAANDAVSKIKGDDDEAPRA